MKIKTFFLLGVVFFMGKYCPVRNWGGVNYVGSRRLRIPFPGFVVYGLEFTVQGLVLH